MFDLNEEEEELLYRYEYGLMTENEYYEELEELHKEYFDNYYGEDE